MGWSGSRQRANLGTSEQGFPAAESQNRTRRLEMTTTLICHGSKLARARANSNRTTVQRRPTNGAPEASLSVNGTSLR